MQSTLANLSKLTFNSRKNVSNTSFSSSNSPRFKRTRTISCIETTGVQNRSWRVRSSNSISESSEKQSHSPQTEEIKKEVRALKQQLKSVYCCRSWYSACHLFLSRSGVRATESFSTCFLKSSQQILRLASNTQIKNFTILSDQTF